jgi:hypothetical protein
MQVYTKSGKWYSLIYLGIFTIGSLVYAVLAMLGTYGVVSSGEIFRAGAIAIAGIMAIVGIIQGKSWVKWLAMFLQNRYAIAIYAFLIIVAIVGLFNSLQLGSGFSMFANSNTLMLLRVWRLIVILTSVIGIILLLQKPRGI